MGPGREALLSHSSFSPRKRILKHLSHTAELYQQLYSIEAFSHARWSQIEAQKQTPRIYSVSEATHFGDAREDAALRFRHQSSCNQIVAKICALGALALALLLNSAAAITILWPGSDLGHIISLNLGKRAHVFPHFSRSHLTAWGVTSFWADLEPSLVELLVWPITSKTDSSSSDQVSLGSAAACLRLLPLDMDPLETVGRRSGENKLWPWASMRARFFSPTQSRHPWRRAECMRTLLETNTRERDRPQQKENQSFRQLDLTLAYDRNCKYGWEKHLQINTCGCRGTMQKLQVKMSFRCSSTHS